MKNPKLGSVFLAAQGSDACAPETRGEGPEIAVVVAPTARRNGRYMARPGEGHSYLGHHAEIARTKNVMALSERGCIPFAERGL